MNTYTLFEKPNGYVELGIPDLTKGHIPLRTVQAKTWIEAREKCIPFENKLIAYNPGHGWIKK